MNRTLKDVIELLRLNIEDKQRFMNELLQSGDPVKTLTANFVALNIADLVQILDDLKAVQFNSPPGE